MTNERIDRRKFLFLSLSPIAASAVGVGDAVAQISHHATARSGAETRVHFFRGNTEQGLEPDVRITITQRPAHGTAHIAMRNQSSGTGRPIRVAEVYYKSKAGYVGTDTFSYQRTGRSGSSSYTMSVNVVP